MEIEKFENLKRAIENVLEVELGKLELNDTCSGFQFSHANGAIQKYLGMSIENNHKDISKIAAKEITVEDLYAELFLKKDNRIELFRRISELQDYAEKIETEEYKSFCVGILDSLGMLAENYLRNVVGMNIKLAKLALMSSEELELRAAIAGV